MERRSINPAPSFLLLFCGKKVEEKILAFVLIDTNSPPTFSRTVKSISPFEGGLRGMTLAYQPW